MRIQRSILTRLELFRRRWSGWLCLGVVLSLIAFVIVALIRMAMAADPGVMNLSPNYGPTTGGTSVTITRTPNWSEQQVEFPFTGGQQTFTAPVTGRYKLETWGAQGGGDPLGTANGSYGGLGGYSSGVVTLTAGQTVYINVGIQPTSTSGGYNGGGTVSGSPGWGGGGATHMALATGTLDAFNANRTQVLIVAGGGGGGQGLPTSTKANCANGSGGAGGGTAGTAGTCSVNANGGGGTQSAGGAAGGGQGSAGTFGAGGDSSQSGGSEYGGGGGGGWHGGGGGSGGKGGGGGGGSGYVGYASMTEGVTIAGNASFPSPSGGTETGHAGNGHARITILEEGLFSQPVVYFDGVRVPVTGYTDSSVTVTAPAHAGGIANVWIEGDEETVGEFYYWVPATSYTNECTTDGGATWSTVEYTNANTPTRCRIVLNNSFDGTISLTDDYYKTIGGAVSGAFASADSRFNAGTNTFTISRADSLDSSGQVLEYTYTSPTWDSLTGYYSASNHDDLFWPGIEVTATPDNMAQPIALSGDQLFFGLWAESYRIIPNDPSYNTESEYTFTLSTYGAPYEGTIRIVEDLGHSDDPSGASGVGVFRPSNATINFANAEGADMEFYYTPYTTAVAPNHIELRGESAGPAITNDTLDINVVPATIYLTGATRLARGETGEFTLRVDIAPNYSGTVQLADIVGGAPFAIDGIFTDTSSSPNPTGTFNPDSNTYTFTAGVNETYIRTFSYTMPDSTGGSLTARLTATSNTNDYTFINIAVIANKMTFKCSASYPNCQLAYVGDPKDYVIQPNGIFTGDATFDSTAGGSFGLGSSYSWSDTSTAISTSYTPTVTGRHHLSALVSNSTNPGMNGETFVSTDEESLNNYLWVIANQMSITGDNEIANAGNGYFTLTMNGPYQGNVYLNDTVGGVDQNGTFENGGVCALTFADYHEESNTTSCTFMYTPTIEADNRNITLTPSMPAGYAPVMSVTSHNVLVYGYPQIDSVSPDNGASTGNTTIYITGSNLTAVSFVTLDGLVCTNLRIISDTAMSCQTPARGAGTVNIEANGNKANPLPYTYFNAATDYVTECSVDDGATWTASPYVDPGTTVPCRTILNGRFQGTVSISDDFYDTIDSDLGGVIASSDQRFYSDVDGNYFTLGFPDTADELGRTLEFDYTSPTWGELETYYQEDGSTDDDLYWPLIEVNVVSSDGGTIISSSDDVVFGLYAQEYFFSPNGNYDYYCVGCEAAFLVSTHGAPYEGTITMAEDLSNSDDPSGTPGVFTAGGELNNTVLDFVGSDGTVLGGGYIPYTTAEGAGTYISLCGTSANPAIRDICIDIAPVINSGIRITPDMNSISLLRGQTGIFTLEVTIGNDWDGTVKLDDVFAVGGAGGGVFADISGGGNPTGTFNSSTNTYTFAPGAGETYIRTFSYTMRDDSVAGPYFPGYIMQITGETGDTAHQTYVNVNVIANRIIIKCGNGYPNCTTGYVGTLKDYSYSPNGMLVGTATVTASDAGELGTLTWNTASAFTMSYLPTMPGRQVLTATVESSNNNPAIIGHSFDSTAADSLNDYIWVMANSMQLTGPNVLKSGATGEFTLTMNGPFVGTIDLEDLVDDSPAGGGFSNNGSCSFSLSDYDEATNTTSCVFNYLPQIYDDSTTVVLVPSMENYDFVLDASSTSVLVYGKPIITAIDPEEGPTTGGNTVTLTGENLAQNDLITVGNIVVSSSSRVIIDDNTIMLTMPPNAAGPVDIAVTVGTRIYHHPDIYTYIPKLINIEPDVGPTAGGTGFGLEYDPNGIATITGEDLLPYQRYSDGTKQYHGLDYLNFNGSQYINTGVSQLGNTKMTLDATRDSGIGAAGIAASGDYFMMLLTETGFRLPTARYGNSLDVSAGGAMNAGDRIVATLDANGSSANFSVSINGSAANSNPINPANAPDTAHNIYLGRVNNGAGGASPGIVGKVYGFSIDKDGDANDRNFVPVCSESGAGGMFDTLHDTFYPASTLLGSTPFDCEFSDLTPPTVSFGNVVVPANDVAVIDSSTITVIPPAHAEGVVDVNVTVNGVTATLVSRYTYRAPLEILTVSPPYGSLSGGTPLTITGRSFIPLSGIPPEGPILTVMLDNEGTPVACEDPVVTNSTITCTTTAHDYGLVSVTVDNGEEIYTMEATPDPDGDGNMPTIDDQGRSTGGFLYSNEVEIFLDLSAATVGLEVSPYEPFDEDYMTASVTTNNPAGYTLYIQANAADLICSTDSSLVVPSTTGNAVDAGSWGFQVGTSTVSDGWATVPLVQTPIASNNGPTYTTPGSPTAANTQVNFAIRDNALTPCAAYSQTVVYTAVVN